MASKKNHYPVDLKQQPAGTAEPGTDAGAVPGNRLRRAKDAAARTSKTAKTPPKTPGAKTKAKGKAQAKAPHDKKLSALDAAAKVLQEAGRPLNCQEMIADMAAKGYWSSRSGRQDSRRPLCTQRRLREIKTKSTQARFQKTARGQFIYQNPQAS